MLPFQGLTRSQSRRDLVGVELQVPVLARVPWEAAVRSRGPADEQRPEVTCCL